MQPKSLDLAWIVVKDFKKAIQFYTETVGLKLGNVDENYGWAELQGHNGGAYLGIAQEQSGKDGLKSGQNACVTFTVDNIEKAISDLKKKGAHCVGPLQEVPGHVKLQMVTDEDGNSFQIVEKLDLK